jgi:hypothetical protein
MSALTAHRAVAAVLRTLRVVGGNGGASATVVVVSPRLRPESVEELVIGQGGTAARAGLRGAGGERTALRGIHLVKWPGWVVIW